MFIAGRAVAGAGGSGVVLGSFSIVSFIIPLVQRPCELASRFSVYPSVLAVLVPAITTARLVRTAADLLVWTVYIGILSSVFSVATVVGPILGGAFTQNATWRWCFYVNLPIGGAAAVALALVFNLPPQPRDKSALVDRLRQLDLVGAALFIPAVLMALLALQWGGSTYAWHSATIIGLFVGFGGLLAVFVGWEVYMKDDAMIPLSMVLSRTIAFSSLIGLFALGGVFVAVYYLPEWFQVVKGASPVGSGVMNIPAFLSQVLATILAGGLVAQFGALNPWLWLGAVLMAVGTGLYGTLDIDTSSGRWIGYQILQGFGFGTVAQMPVVALQTVLTPAQAPVGMAIAAFAQFFGSAIFVGIAQAIFTNVLVSQLAVEAPGVDVQALLLAGSGAVRHIVSPEDLPAVLEAFNKAIVSTFYLSAAACAAAVLVSLGLPWINLKAKRPVVSPGEA